MNQQHRFLFTEYAKKQFIQLDQRMQDIVCKKLSFFKESQLFEKNVKKLFHLPPATYRIRIGSYRLLLMCDFETKEHRVLKIGQRKDIYR